MIRTLGLTKRFGRTLAVDALDLIVPKGAVTGFLGPNGAGKSTTIRMICGYLRPNAGSVRIDGIDVHASARSSLEARRRIGYLPESTPLYTEMRVVEFLRFRARLYGMPRRERHAAIGRALDRCWLKDVRRRTIGHLSKGYRQRVGLAAAILHAPPVLILDEPTVGLDPTQIRAFRDLIRELAGDHTIVLSTHILPEVEMTCDRFIMIAGGKVRLEGAIDDLRARAAESSTYIVETTSPAVAIRMRALPAIADVSEQSLEDSWREVRLRTVPGQPDIRTALVTELEAMDAPFRELHREVASLEQLFVSVTSGDPTVASPRPDAKRSEA